jgi:hypothetical protein
MIFCFKSRPETSNSGTDYHDVGLENLIHQFAANHSAHRRVSRGLVAMA